MSGGLRVVVLTSGAIGVEVAARLARLAEVQSLTVVTTRVAPRPQSALQKARVILRHDGPGGLARAAVERLARTRGGTRVADLVGARCPGIAHLHCEDLHAAASRDRLQGLEPDLGVVAGTYVLRPEVFGIPRLGCLNLHLGQAPEFRGSSPGFYELLEGVPRVGVTVHRVTAALDGGAILAQEVFPLDLAPPGDPLEFLRNYQRETLLPNGARMMAEVVAGLSRGPVAEQHQDTARARTRRRATWRQKRELRRVVEARRRGALARAGLVDILPGGPVS
ncbi:MAG: hypothetical protein M3Q93_00970 [Gemmatimonadota bacterium]|nr:hypothetical protein [Gemmatimonadota bacterium]